jgi:hypothetical protein
MSQKAKAEITGKEHPNVCTEVTLQTASLANHLITSDCGWQH